MMEAGDSWLMADYSVSCDGQEYMFYSFYAGASILLISLGLPALYFALLYRARNQLYPSHRVDAEGTKHKRSELETLVTRFSIEQRSELDHLSFLVGMYELNFYWWPVVEILRKLFLTGGAIMFSIATGDDPHMNGIYGIVISIMVTVLIAYFNPYAVESDTWTAVYSNTLLFCLIYCGQLLEAATFFDIDSTTVEAFLITATMGFFVMAVFSNGYLWWWEPLENKCTCLRKCPCSPKEQESRISAEVLGNLPNGTATIRSKDLPDIKRNTWTDMDLGTIQSDAGLPNKTAGSSSRKLKKSQVGAYSNPFITNAKIDLDQVSLIQPFDAPDRSNSKPTPRQAF
jgi:hypothetical protein